MAEIANRHYRDIAITVGKHTWLLIEYLKIPLPLSRKLASRFVGLFTIFCAIGLGFF